MKILCIGQLVADILTYPVETVDYGIDTVCVDAIEVKNGGDAMNTAVSMGYLKNQVYFVGRVGEDDFGKLLAERFDGAGVKARLIRTPGEATSSTVVLINRAGERTFLHCAGANRSLTARDVKEEELEGAGIVHIGGTYILPGLDGTGALEIFRRAHAHGAVTTMDVTYDTTGRWMEVIRPCLAELDYFLPSIGEARKITGENEPEKIARALLEAGVKTVVLKLGKDGCYVRSRESCFYQKGYPVQAKDTTGAGDSFVAGFLTGLAEKRNLEECARMGCAAGSVCVSEMGATTKRLSREVIGRMTGINR